MRRTKPSPGVLSAAIRHAAASAAPACVLDVRGTYVFANEAWQRSESRRRGDLRMDALEGSSVVDQLESDELRAAWAAALERVVTRGTPRALTGEDNTPELARLTSTRLEPIAWAGNVLGVLLVRTTVRERPLSELYALSGRAKDAYVDARGHVALCPCCRRARDGADPEIWEIVPGWVAAPPTSARWITCDLCAELHLGVPRGVTRAA